MREITREIVSALIFSSEGKLLMGMKDPAKGGVYSDCWHIPGGGIDEDEEKINALQREVKEETNLDISQAKIKLIDDRGKGKSEKVLKTGEAVICNMNFNVYEVRLASKSDSVMLKPTDDLVELRWFSREDLNKVKLTPPSVELFKRIGLIY